MMISLHEYLSTVFEPDCEYVDGELVERNTGELEHSALQGIIGCCFTTSGMNAEFTFFRRCAFRWRPPDIASRTSR